MMMQLSSKKLQNRGIPFPHGKILKKLTTSEYRDGYVVIARVSSQIRFADASLRSEFRSEGRRKSMQVKKVVTSSIPAGYPMRGRYQTCSAFVYIYVVEIHGHSHLTIFETTIHWPR